MNKIKETEYLIGQLEEERRAIELVLNRLKRRLLIERGEDDE